MNNVMGGSSSLTNYVIYYHFCKPDLNQTGVPQEDEFDRAKEQQDLVLEEVVPKLNKEATKLVDVYNLTDIIDVEILDSLNDEAISVLKASPDVLP